MNLESITPFDHTQIPSRMLRGTTENRATRSPIGYDNGRLN